MRKRLIISAFFLAGITMSVAAYSSSPPEVVDDVGTTKVLNVAELSHAVIINAQANLELVYVNSGTEKVEAPTFFSEKPVLISEPIAIEPDNPVTARLRYANYNRKTSDKIYLLNCDIRQHFCRAVFDRTFRLSKQRS